MPCRHAQQWVVYRRPRLLRLRVRQARQVLSETGLWGIALLCGGSAAAGAFVSWALMR